MRRDSMKKWIPAICAVLLTLSGCSGTPELPEHPITFQTGSGDGYMYLSNENKTYVPYCPFRSEYLGECIGYYDTPGDANTSAARVYVYEFEGFSSDEWIVDYDPQINEGMVMREINTTRIPDGLTSEYAWNQ